MERFPNVRDEAQRLFIRDEAFRELCEEYEVCSRAAERLDSSQLEEQPLRREYAALRLRLEGELLRYLEQDLDPGKSK